MNNCPFVKKIFRVCVLSICLFPATFFFYKTWKEWFTAILRGREFFYIIEDNINEIINDIRKQSYGCRFFVGLPLRLARKILLSGCFRAVSSSLGFKPRFKRLSPGVIELIPGLLQDRPQARQQAFRLLKAFPQKKVSITGKAHCILGKDISFEGRKVVVIAHWDPDRVIDHYVIYQCRHFKTLGFDILLTSAGRPEHLDAVACRDFVDAIVYRSCDGYDFTSWKAAFELFPSLYRSRELVLTNDSYFAPIGSFASVHSVMNEIPCDFWGLVGCNLIRPHLQSYYLVLHQSVLQHQSLKDFFDRIALSKDRDVAILYETSFSLWLAVHHFYPAAFVPVSTDFSLNYTFEYWKELIHTGVPILKREFFLKKEYHHKILQWRTECSHKGYPVKLIEDYLERRGIDMEIL